MPKKFIYLTYFLINLRFYKNLLISNIKITYAIPKHKK